MPGTGVGVGILIVAIVIILLLVLASCVKIVPQAQARVLERLGAYPVSYTHLKALP